MMTYHHREAFALMWYVCPCGHRERIWNSRDGVTPFGGVFCPSCHGSHLTHTWLKEDVIVPEHILAIGQRYFRDGTAGDAITIIKRRIGRQRAAGHPIPLDMADELLAQARAQTGGEWTIGWPMVDRWDQAKANAADRSADAKIVPLVPKR